MLNWTREAIPVWVLQDLSFSLTTSSMSPNCRWHSLISECKVTLQTTNVRKRLQTMEMTYKEQWIGCSTIARVSVRVHSLLKITLWGLNQLLSACRTLIPSAPHPKQQGILKLPFHKTWAEQWAHKCLPNMAPPTTVNKSQGLTAKGLKPYQTSNMNLFHQTKDTEIIKSQSVWKTWVTVSISLFVFIE